MNQHKFWCWTIGVSVGAGGILFEILAQNPKFGERVDRGLIEHKPIKEASGLAASRKNSQVLWTHNDSGGKNCVYALDTQGKHLGVYTIAGVTARDWEDIALGPGPIAGQDYLYIGDIGDNSARQSLKYIHRIPEPVVNAKQAPVDSTLAGAETITVQYPDRPHDAETLMIDPLTKDLYIVSKQDTVSLVYRAAFPQSTAETIKLEHVATLAFGGAVAGDISPAGDGILIKTYVMIYYWPRGKNENVWDALAKPPATMPYILEPQGEAVAWQAQGNGYYTLSESFRGLPVRLYFYPRHDGQTRPTKRMEKPAPASTPSN